MPLHAIVESLSWESAFFHRASGRLLFSDAAPVLNAAAMAQYDIVQAKIPANATAQADALAALGFRLAESEVDLSVSLPERPDVETFDGVRRAVESDIPILCEAARTTFALSRFRAPWYAAEDSGRFYARWMENAVLGTFDDVCLLLEDGHHRPQGWVTLRQLPEQEARIGLLAVWPGHTGRGIGRRLMQAAETWCRQQDVRRLRVATQLGNMAALRLYLSSGARIDSTAHWLYR
ncbi:TDP-fucosamine acetyltransferase [Lonsdalea britannica]|uniref:dTDP-fucosamine acetyltransferase n=1 Tax=Lonsdalea britannica TaxID=1082704 RepID=A0AAD0WK32_9GAMM|nr:dTDP-4-amino-4,6-dideoxy-D-galactose acyltransferase [Lonsdalea britannica]AXW86255.1 dTDP-4-amino-4,6-dideoxy-D-galactose acyltransferase [Lonsdalea britannica]OSM94367.1 TDP-fucosamine acetyltransferase [Lonsdalea britannica]OSN06004.1 TDP-fucosamine acetyltransferase [Lonsdalea britannica]